MIDTHCHLLPGLDDGPRRIEQSVALARELTGAGVRHVICTPHYSRRFPTDHDTATARLEELRQVLAAAGIPLELGLGAEIGSSAALEADMSELIRRALGPGHLLVEVDRGTPAGFLELLLERLRKFERRAVLAHPERCPALHSRPHLIDMARKRGTLVQIVAPSLVGRSGQRAAAAAWRLLESGRADILASDSHRTSGPGGGLALSLDLLRKRMGSELLYRLTEEGPSSVIDAEPAVR